MEATANRFAQKKDAGLTNSSSLHLLHFTRLPSNTMSFLYEQLLGRMVTPTTPLNGRNVIVTGSNTGLGVRPTARALLQFA